MMSENLNLDTKEELKLHLDGDIYPLDWRNLHSTPDDRSAIPLPSAEQAIRAAHTQ